MSEPSLRRSVLVTGFEPFGGSTLNPSQWIVESLAKIKSRAGVALHTALLPVDTRAIAGAIASIWQTYEPDIVLHVGESAKADRLTLERVALNLLDFDQPDNTGQVVRDQPIDPTGPPARFVTLPVRSLQAHLTQVGIQSALSLSAGAYLCNQALYLSLAQAESRSGSSVGFVHVPSLHQQVVLSERQSPSMPADQLVEQFRLLLDHAIDLHLDGDGMRGIDRQANLR